jgi:hypothetical protein
MNHRSRSVTLVATAALSLVPASLFAQASHDLPLKYAGPPTTPAITAGDLMTRLYIYADDSMRGRDVLTQDNVRATAYIAREAERLGLEPAGDNGTYFQSLPIVRRAVDSATSTLTVAGKTFAFGTGFLANTSGRQQGARIDAIFFGTAIDTTNLLTPSQVEGKYIALRPATPPPNFNQAQFVATEGYKRYIAMVRSARGVMLIVDSISAASRDVYFRPRSQTIVRDFVDSPLNINVTLPVAEAMFGAAPASLARGTAAQPATITLHVNDTPAPAGRNVVAILRGSDPKLRGEYVVIGAHNDHIGVRPQGPLDHDSIKVFNMVARPQGAESAPSKLTPDDWTRINAAIDSLRKIHGGPRPDSVYNGADDDGSGTVSVLEMAEAFAKGKDKPKRSILFAWHAGEEHGMWGSEYLVNNPPVPRDSMVAEINIDMVGRGAPTDITGTDSHGQQVHGAERYVQLVGSRRLSTELGNLVEAVNNGSDYHFTLDYALDANGHPANIYCRSDHAMYAAWGIPVVFFTTGGHQDYHQLTDEPQYIRYDHMALLDRMMFDVAMRVANLDHRLVVDGQKMSDPHGACRQ